MNTLYYGDNLGVLRESIKDESADLIYLDPPFNSKRDYNLLFKSPKGHVSDASITAFEDTWHWATEHDSQAEREFSELLHQPNTDVAELMKALRSFLGENDLMAYLTMMANRLLEMHRVLKPTGSLYLHCDPTAAHYLKLVLDAVFGPQKYRNEIIWMRTAAKGDVRKKFGSNHDVILVFAKGDTPIFKSVYTAPNDAYLGRFKLNDNDGKGPYRLAPLDSPHKRINMTYDYKGFSPPANGWRVSRKVMERLDAEDRLAFPKTAGGRIAKKHYLHEQLGPKVGDVWIDIPPLQASAAERLGYPTQKPLALLERILTASSNEGDIILDPFCGCGTAVHAAQKLGRQWIGIDITHLAISLIEKRLKSAFGETCKFEVKGTPNDVESARDLFSRGHDGKYQFQWWAVSLIDAQPYQGKKKGADGGIDGIKFFNDIEGDVKKIVISVKGGALKADDVRALGHVREREGAEIAILISLEKPTAKMRADGASCGFYEGGADGKTKYPRIQFLTIEGLLAKTQRAEHPDFEPNKNFKKAKREKAPDKQKRLLD